MTAKTFTFTACVLAALLALGLPARAQVAGAGAAEAVKYMQSRQNADGGFSEPGAASDDRLTGWAVLAGVCGSDNPAELISYGAHALSYFSARAPAITDLRQIEQSVLALSEAGLDPRNIQGRNMVSLINANIGSDGKIGKSIEEHCWGIIALSAAREKLAPKVTEWLVSKQRGDGGWGESDAVLVSDTALAIEALVAAGEADAETVDPATELLMSRMNGDGGFAVSLNKTSNGQLTSSVVRAIYAAGGDPTSEDWDLQGLNPQVFLQSLQAADGHFQFSKGVDSEPALTTAMAVPALKGKHFPLRAAAMKVSPDGTATDNSSPVDSSKTTGADITGESTVPGAVEEASPLATSNGDAKQLSTGEAYTSGIKAGAVTRRTGWFSGLWLFLALCLAYVAFLAGAALVASKLSEPHSIPRP